jgi:DNA repair protein RecO (recombination protein O)
LAEGVPYPRVYSAVDGLLSAIELAPAARVWAGAVAQYETLLLAELGYAEDHDTDSAPVAMMAQTRKRLVAHVLGDRRADVMAARERLVERLKRAVA